MKKVAVFISIFLFFVFFVWAFWGNFGALFLFHLPVMAVLFIVSETFFVFVPADRFAAGLIRKIEKYRFFVFPFIAFLFSLAISLFVFRGLPHAPDEINYKYLAEAILDGRITTPLHPHYEFFHILYTNPTISGTYSIYQIGYSVFLAPFVFLKVPFLCNPLLNAVSVFLTGKIAEDFFGRKNALVAMFLASFSVFTALLGGTLMAHSFCAACTLGAFYFSLLAIKNSGKKRVVFAAVSALFISFLMFIRPQNALFTLLFVVGYLFVFIDKKAFIELLLFMGCVISVFLVLFLYSNYAISGNFSEFKHTKYWNIAEPDDDCMGLGLGKGCKFGTYYEMPENGLTLPLAFKITAERLGYFVSDFVFSPFMLLFLLLAFLLLKDRLEFKKSLILLTGYLVIPVVYFFYYYADNGYGARYYYECSFFLFPLIANGIMLAYKKSETFFSQPFLKRGVFVSALLFSSLIFQTFWTLPAMRSFYSKDSWGADSLLAEALEKKNIKEGVVFISPEFFYANGAALMNLHKIDENKLIFALNLGYPSNQNLMDYYKGKKFYIAVFQLNEYKKPEIIEIGRDESVSEITAEADKKSYPLDGTPDYCNKFPQFPDFTNKYSGFTLPKEMVSDTVFFFCRFTGADQFYTFGQYFEKEGNYRVRITFAATPESGKFYVESGKNSEKVDFYAQNAQLKTSEFRMFFEKGMNFIKLVPDLEGRENVYFIIDKFEFIKDD